MNRHGRISHKNVAIFDLMFHALALLTQVWYQ